MPHLDPGDQGLEHVTVVDEDNVPDNATSRANFEVGPEPGDAWEFRSVHAFLHLTEAGSAGQFTRFQAALELTFQDQAMVTAPDMDNITDPVREDRNLFYEQQSGHAQVIDATNGLGAGGDPVEIHYRDVWQPGEVVLPSPGELTVNGNIANDFGGATVDVEVSYGMTLHYQLLEGEGLRFGRGI